MFFFLIIALVLFFAFNSGRCRLPRGWSDRNSASTAELEQVIEDQRLQIEWLEERIARLEDGLEFTERMLGEAAAVTGKRERE